MYTIKVKMIVKGKQKIVWVKAKVKLKVKIKVV